MLLSNSRESEFVNGSLVKILSWGKTNAEILEYIEVSLMSKPELKIRLPREKTTLTLMDRKHCPHRLIVKQFPLMVAYALTVHKCQSLTLQSVEYDGSKSFRSRLDYVAMSRVTEGKNLKITGWNFNQNGRDLKQAVEELNSHKNLSDYVVPDERDISEKILSLKDVNVKELREQSVLAQIRRNYEEFCVRKAETLELYCEEPGRFTDEESLTRGLVDEDSRRIQEQEQEKFIRNLKSYGSKETRVQEKLEETIKSGEKIKNAEEIPVSHQFRGKRTEPLESGAIRKPLRPELERVIKASYLRRGLPFTHQEKLGKLKEEKKEPKYIAELKDTSGINELRRPWVPSKIEADCEVEYESIFLANGTRKKKLVNESTKRFKTQETKRSEVLEWMGGIHGMKNYHNSCWFNAVMQVLAELEIPCTVHEIGDLLRDLRGAGVSKSKHKKACMALPYSKDLYEKKEFGNAEDFLTHLLRVGIVDSDLFEVKVDFLQCQVCLSVTETFENTNLLVYEAGIDLSLIDSIGAEFKCSFCGEALEVLAVTGCHKLLYIVRSRAYANAAANSETYLNRLERRLIIGTSEYLLRATIEFSGGSKSLHYYNRIVRDNAIFKVDNANVSEVNELDSKCWIVAIYEKHNN